MQMVYVVWYVVHIIWRVGDMVGYVWYSIWYIHMVWYVLDIVYTHTHVCVGGSKPDMV